MLVVVNVHLLNKPKPTVKYVDKLIDHIRSMNVWKDAYIMGDFNADDIKNKWKPTETYAFVNNSTLLLLMVFETNSIRDSKNNLDFLRILIFSGF